MWAIRALGLFDGERFSAGGGTVLVDAGRILAVQDRTATLPLDCPVLDHPGTVLPGLIDTHTHLVGDSAMGALDRVAGYSADDVEAVVRAALAAQLAAGVTTVRDLGDRRFNVVDRTPLPAEPTVLAAGPPLTSPGGHCFYLGGEVHSPAEIRSAIADRVDHGVDVVKVMASGGMLTPGTDQLGCQFSDADLRLIVDLSHAAGLAVTAHAHARDAVRQAMACGVDGIEHCSCYTERGPVVDVELMDSLAAAGVVVCATAGGDMRELGSPPPHVAALLDRMGITVDDLVERRRGLLGQLYRSGVRFTCGVDSGVLPVKPHGSVVRAAAEHAAAGIPTTEVLAAATSVSAEVCGLPTKGRLAAGMDADLVLIDGDPTADIGALGRVAGVVVAGTVLIGPQPVAGAID